MKRTIFALLCAGIMISGFTASAAAQDTKTVKFSVSMTCENCVEKITENISFEKGVKDLNISLDDKTVEVTYDPSKTDEKTLSEAISKLGYEVKTVKPGKKLDMKESSKVKDSDSEQSSEKAGDKIKGTAETVGDKTVETANKVGEKTVETANKVGEKTKETAETVGEKTKETANKVGDKTKDAANKVGDFFKKDKSE